jgi:tRNA pseudouridine32 synthase/23S rRNA pseudouridine746 synthase/23S rRNA pseudouridine1911/1915/1917 synthase
VSLLYEDDDILVVDKPGGLLTMGSERDKSRTVHTLLNDYVRKGNPKSRHRVYIVHRLDRDTSGILLFAKSEQAKLFLQSDWDNTGKIYLAVVCGRPSPARGTISSYLAENAALNVYSTADPARGKLAQTAYTVVKEHKGLSLVQIELLTGRKHQIRVHFADKGHPLVGDRKYGKGQMAAAHLALHAHAISFTHPVSGARLHFETRIPELFSRLVGAFTLP